jgi:hypothetical protein
MPRSLVQLNFAAARAVQLRYLARRSLRLRADPAQGADFMWRALQSDWRRLMQEPRRTIATAVAVAARFVFSLVKAVVPPRFPPRCHEPPSSLSSMPRPTRPPRRWFRW